MIEKDTRGPLWPPLMSTLAHTYTTGVYHTHTQIKIMYNKFIVSKELHRKGGESSH